MDDRQIQQLIRMAGEIDRLEQGGPDVARIDHTPIFRIQARPADRWKLVRVASLGGIAAAVLLSGVVAMRLSMPPAAPVTPGPIAIVPPPSVSHTTPVVQAEDAQGCVVLTMFKDGDKCNCVQMQTRELAGALESMPRAELIGMALRSPCSTTAQKVVVLAVSGRKDALPKTREDAEALAASITGESHSDIASNAYAAMPSLGANATVISETVAWKRPSLQLEGPDVPGMFRQ